MPSNIIKINNGGKGCEWNVPDSKMERVIECLNAAGIKNKWIITTKEEEAKSQGIIRTKTEWLTSKSPKEPNPQKSSNPLGNMLKKIN